MQHLLRCLTAFALIGSSHQAPAEQLLFGSGTTLYTYDTATDQLGLPLSVTGLQFLRSIDFRSDGRLYALDAAPQPQLYTVDLLTGAATPVGSPLAALTDSTVFDMDFNDADILRIVSQDTGVHLQVDPDTGAVLGVGPSLSILGIGHSGAAAYGLGGEFYRSLVNVNLTTGSTTPIGEIFGSPVPTFGFGFDVSPGSGKAYGYYDTLFGVPEGELYEIDLATGQATFLRRSAIFIPTLTIIPVPEPGPVILILSLTTAAIAQRTCRRRRRASHAARAPQSY